MASAITFTSLNFTGTPNSDDNLAARYAITVENMARSSTVPPGTPLPFDTPGNVKASYLTILINAVTGLHNSNIVLSKGPSGAQAVLTDAQIEQIRVNLITRLNNGESAASIIADTATL